MVPILYGSNFSSALLTSPGVSQENSSTSPFQTLSKDSADTCTPDEAWNASLTFSRFSGVSVNACSLKLFSFSHSARAASSGVKGEQFLALSPRGYRIS